MTLLMTTYIVYLSRKHNRSATEQSFHLPLRSNLIQCQHDITPQMTYQKISPSRKEYL